MAQRSGTAPHRAGGDEQWRCLPESYRALVIRNRIDEVWLQITQQHERILAYCGQVTERGLRDVPPAVRATAQADAESFIAALRRMLRVGDLMRASGLSAVLRQPSRLFASQLGAATVLRNQYEQVDTATVDGRGGIGYRVMPDRLLITHGTNKLDTRSLLEAARVFHRAVRAAVDPMAVKDPHYHPPFADLGPNRITELVAAYRARRRGDGSDHR